MVIANIGENSMKFRVGVEITVSMVIWNAFCCRFYLLFLFSYKCTNSIQGDTTPWPHYLSEAPFLNIITLAIRASTYGFGGHKHFIYCWYFDRNLRNKEDIAKSLPLFFFPLNLILKKKIKSLLEYEKWRESVSHLAVSNYLQLHKL